jgi:hypothetical protein
VRYILLITTLFSYLAFSQEKYVELPEVIHESSALVKYNDVFISLNDSGNKNMLYVFSENGVILNECKINNATNVDWEALTFDGDSTLYIGDIGNNDNLRKDQRIYSVSIQNVVSDSTTQAEIIDFNYPDQESFPPEEKNLYYDAETLIHRNDSLFILTKNRTVPFDGIIKVYGLSTKPGKQVPKRYPDIQLEASSWIEDSATDGVLYGDLLFLMTYSKVYVFDWNGAEFKKTDKAYHFDFFTQKEGIAVDDNFIYISEENEEKLSDAAYLYRIKR